MKTRGNVPPILDNVIYLALLELENDSDKVSALAVVDTDSVAEVSRSKQKCSR